MAQGYRSQQNKVSVSVDGVDLGWAMMKSGGGSTVDPVKVFPGGMQTQISLGGTKTREDAELTFLFSDYLRGKYKWLDSRVGEGNVTITEQLGGSGGTDVTTGVLTSLAKADYDANASESYNITLTVSLNAEMA